MCGLQVTILIIGLFQFSFSHSPKLDYDSIPTVQSNTPQTALSECHLQIECTAPSHQNVRIPSQHNGSDSSSSTRRIRIPVRAARGPQGPPGLRGPTGPRGPPGISSEINEHIVAHRRFKRRVVSQRMPSFTPPERSSVVWRLEEQSDYEDIHVLELRVGPHGFNDRLATLDDFAGSCSIEMFRPNTSGAQYCLSFESMLPEFLSTSVGIVIDWDAIEGTTANEIWKVFQQRLVDEKIFRPAYAAYSASFHSKEAYLAWQRSLQDNTRRTNAANANYFLDIKFFSTILCFWMLKANT
nr:hypothetical protein HmN_000534400 [Hymenolepis microstoma]